MATMPASSWRVAAATVATAWSKAAWLAEEGLAVPLIFRTYWSAAASISSAVAGGSKLWSVWIDRHIRADSRGCSGQGDCAVAAPIGLPAAVAVPHPEPQPAGGYAGGGYAAGGYAGGGYAAGGYAPCGYMYGGYAGGYAAGGYGADGYGAGGDEGVQPGGGPKADGVQPGGAHQPGGGANHRGSGG